MHISHLERQLRTHIRGDDYVTAGKASDLKLLRKQFEAMYGIKTQVLDPEKEDQQQVNVPKSDPHSDRNRNGI